MLEAVRDDRGLSYLASTSIAQQADLHDVTVRASRRKLIELGYFEQVRAGGQKRATVCRPNHRLVEAVPASTASSVMLIQPVLGTFPTPSPANDAHLRQPFVHAPENFDIVAPEATVILTSGGDRLSAGLFGAAPDPLAFGRWVREQRLRLGLSQSALARRIGCRQLHLANVERGHDRLGEWPSRRLRELIEAAA
jgi:DNA-binding XRE family transcriptional regulator